MPKACPYIAGGYNSRFTAAECSRSMMLRSRSDHEVIVFVIIFESDVIKTSKNCCIFVHTYRTRYTYGKTYRRNSCTDRQ